MKTTTGEYLVGAYLKLCCACAVIDYNVRPPAAGIEGLDELDVVGFDFTKKSAFLCEVATHLGGLEYGKGYKDTLQRIENKFQRQQNYAAKYLSNFENHIFMFWAPRVPVGFLTANLAKIEGLELVINGTYSAKVEELKALARQTTKDSGNPVFRTLQILEHLR